MNYRDIEHRVVHAAFEVGGTPRVTLCEHIDDPLSQYHYGMMFAPEELELVAEADSAVTCMVCTTKMLRRSAEGNPE